MRLGRLVRVNCSTDEVRRNPTPSGSDVPGGRHRGALCGSSMPVRDGDHDGADG